ncbi:MAG TPA: sigma-70 family RNA polymerase sigma factor [Ktedonobacterales bacterium]|jgi:RNA polymerase sigma-70 factor, ECF subfamily|nr:sigma-70 family RNA polymerase sigma factor [Ktedonobacterales bacterium]
MDERKHDALADRFEAERSHLRAVAYRMLGSLSDADDAVQECWLRLSRADTSSIENLGAWLTTVVGRVCIDMLRARQSRREESLGYVEPEPGVSTRREDTSDPEEETLLADSVGLALLVVLDTLTPTERLAFVLHDLFDVPFEEIAPIVDRSPDAARQLASRARRRVRGTGAVPDADLAPQRTVVDAFLAASRAGNFEALLTLLDPEVVFRADRAAMATGASAEMRGAVSVAKQFLGRAQAARPVLLNGAVGVVVAPRGRLFVALRVTINEGKITEMDAIADPEYLRSLDLAVLPSEDR